MAPDIRTFKDGDLPALQEIRAAAFAPVFRSFRAIVGPGIAGPAFAGAEAEQADLLDGLCSGNAAETMLVAEWNGEVAGFCAYGCDHTTGVGEIGLNAVAPGYQRRGIATALFDTALARMVDAGMTVATVGTGGDEAHAPARQAYAKVGFDLGIPNVHLYRRL